MKLVNRIKLTVIVICSCASISVMSADKITQPYRMSVERLLRLVDGQHLALHCQDGQILQLAVLPKNRLIYIFQVLLM